MSLRKPFQKRELGNMTSSIPCPIPRSTKSSRARLSHIKSLCKPAIRIISPLVRLSSIDSTKGKNNLQDVHDRSTDEQVTDHPSKLEPNIKTADDIHSALCNEPNQVNEISTEGDEHKELTIYESMNDEFLTLKDDLVEKQTAIKEVHIYLKQLHERISNLGHNAGNFATDFQLEEISNRSKSDLKTFHIKADNSEQNDLFEILEYTQELMKTVTELTEPSLRFCREVIKNYTDAINWIRQAVLNAGGNVQHVHEKITEWKVNEAELENMLLTITAESKIHLSEVKKTIENLCEKVQICISMVTITNTKYNELKYKCTELEDNTNRTEMKLDVQSNSLDAQPRTEQDDFSVDGLDKNSASSKSLQKDEIESCFNLTDGEFHHPNSETTMSTTCHTEKGVTDEMRSNEKLILVLQDQISNLKTDLTLSENKIKMLRKKMKHVTSQKSSNRDHCNEDLYQEIKSLQFYLAEIQTQNENLSKEIANKNSVILQNEKDINEQHTTLNERKEIIEQLKVKEKELTEQMKNFQSSVTENKKNKQDTNNFKALNVNEIEEMCLKIKKKEADLDPLEKCIAAIQKQQKHTNAKDAERSEHDTKSTHRWRFGFL